MDFEAMQLLVVDYIMEAVLKSSFVLFDPIHLASCSTPFVAKPSSRQIDLGITCKEVDVVTFLLQPCFCLLESSLNLPWRGL